jgi:hypothetical protein
MRAGAESLSACVQITPTDPFHARQLRQLAGSHHEQDRTELCRRLLLLCADGRLLAVAAPAEPSAIPS